MSSSHHFVAALCCCCCFLCFCTSTDCNCCVRKFDHHCPWVGTCVGERNYKYFTMFVYALSVYGLYCAAMSGLLLWTQCKKEKVGNLEAIWKCTFPHNPGPSALGLFSFLVCCSTTTLSVYHCHLVSIQETTNENVKGTFQSTANPNDRGCFANWSAVYCATTRRSQIVATPITAMKGDRVKTPYHRHRECE